jgi:hypothetical protein
VILDPRLEPIVARWRSTTFDGEKQAARHLGETLAQRSGMTFDNVVSMFGGTRPFGSARPRSRAPSFPTLHVEIVRDLARIRNFIASIWFDDELRNANFVTLFGSAPVGRIICADATLAWDAERIAAGTRFRRGNAAADSEWRQAA